MAMKERRCNLFDDDGKPRRLRNGAKGCFRSASVCRFAHPNEREWKTALPSMPPRHDAVADSESAFFYALVHPRDHRDGERVRDRERKETVSPSLPPRPRDTTTTRAPTAPSPRMDTSGTAKRTRSPTVSASSDQLGRSRPHTKDIPPSRRDHPPQTSRRSRSSSMDRAMSRKTSLATSSSTLPPHPPKPSSVPPPPPLPEVPKLPKLPSFALDSTAHAPPRAQKELSVDEQRSAWHERIDIMFTSITSRRDYVKLESDLSQIRLISSSSLFGNMSEADRAHVSAQKAALELQMEVKRKEINETIQKLVGSGFWPILKSPQISDMEKLLGEAKKHVLEIRGLLEDVKHGCATLFKKSPSDLTRDSDRPSKRRRIDAEVDTAVRSASSNTEVMAEPTKRELEEFRDKLTELDGHLVVLQNDITQRDGIISDEIELHIDARLEEEDALYPPVAGPAEVSEVEVEAVVDAKNKELVHAVAVTGDEIGVLAVEVAELITKVNALDARCKALEEENQEFKNKLSQDTLQHTKSQDDLMRRGKEVEAIAAALQAYISQTPGGQVASDLPSADYVIESLDSQLDGLLREKFCAKLSKIQQEVISIVQQGQNRTLDAVSPKITLLLKMVNLVAEQVTKPETDATNTA